MRQKQSRAPATDPAPATHPTTRLPERNQRAVWKDRSWEKEELLSVAVWRPGRRVVLWEKFLEQLLYTSKSFYMFLI
jgi:hypothetical protein